MLNEEHLSRIFFAAVNHKMNTENTDSLRLLREYISETIDLKQQNSTFNFYGFLKATELICKFERVLSIRTKLIASKEQKERIKHLAFVSKYLHLLFWRNFVFDLLFDQWDAFHLSNNDLLKEWLLHEMNGLYFDKHSEQSTDVKSLPAAEEQLSSNAQNCDNKTFGEENSKMLENIARMGFFHQQQQLSKTQKIYLQHIIPIIREIINSRSIHFRKFMDSISNNHQMGGNSKESRATLEMLEKMRSETNKNEVLVLESPQEFGSLLEALQLSSILLAQFIQQNSAASQFQLSIEERFNEARQNFILFVLNTIRIEYTYEFYRQK